MDAAFLEGDVIGAADLFMPAQVEDVRKVPVVWHGRGIEGRCSFWGYSPGPVVCCLQPGNWQKLAVFDFHAQGGGFTREATGVMKLASEVDAVKGVLHPKMGSNHQGGNGYCHGDHPGLV